ncbi:MAG: hypothetical protein ACOVLE_16565 [Pirellula staleyi]
MSIVDPIKAQRELVLILQPDRSRALKLTNGTDAGANADSDNPTSLSQRAVLETSSSKVRVVCGSSARTDLCGGRPAMAVPTAIGSQKIILNQEA